MISFFFARCGKNLTFDCIKNHKITFNKVHLMCRNEERITQLVSCDIYNFFNWFKEILSRRTLSAKYTSITVHSIQYTVYSIQYTVYSTQYTVYSTQYTVHITQYTVHSTQYIVHSIYTVHCTVHMQYIHAVHTLYSTHAVHT